MECFYMEASRILEAFVLHSKKIHFHFKTNYTVRHDVTKFLLNKT